MTRLNQCLKLQLSLMLLVGFFLVIPAFAADATTQPAKASVQTECPVMVGNKIDTNIFSEYQGKKVFFCCQFCKKEFEKNPEKYISRLPQFATAGEGVAHEHSDSHSISGEMIETLGAITLVLLISTVTLGLLRRKWKPRLMLKIHKTCGVLTLLSGLTHAGLVIFMH